MTKRPLFAALLTALVVGLAGCEEVIVASSPVPTPRPPSLGPNVAPQSAESIAMERYLTSVQNDLVTQGLLRRDGGGPDAPFDTKDVVENFIRIALFDEYQFRGGRLVARETESNLRRWESAVRFGVTFGPSVPLAQRKTDRDNITRYARRLSNATRHPINVTSTNANFHVLILNENERRGFVTALRQLVPDLNESTARSILTMPRSTLCHVYAFSAGSGSYAYTKAVAVIRAEHPDLTRLSCVHEELAQGLGLANDSRDARPSIFNDDEEFGLLTKHDELLLRILYDRRLAPGMGPDQARPIVRTIAAELMGSST